MSIGPRGVPELGHQQMVVIRKRRILSPASCVLKDGGVAIDGCHRHLEILDIATGIMYYVPVNDAQADALEESLRTI